MKINEIITESDIHANPTELAGDQVASLKGAVSMPDISGNKSSGNPYQQYRFMIATGLSDGKGTGEQMPAAGAMAGDPLVTCYTEEEFGMIKDAAKMTQAGEIKQISNHKSQEKDDVHRVSPVQSRAPVALKRK